MFKRVVFIFSLLLLPSVVSAENYWVTASALNIRTEPNATANALGKLTNGKIITVQEFVNGWAKFYYKDSSAFVSKKYLKRLANQEQSATIKNNTVLHFDNPKNGKGLLTVLNKQETLSLSKNEYVTVIDFLGNWVKVRYNNNEGYVQAQDINLPIIKIKTKTKTKNNTSSSEEEGCLFFPIVILCIFLSIIHKIYMFRRCPYCNKWAALRTIDEELIDTTPTTIRKTAETRDRNGQVISTRDVYVPATIYTYEVTQRCKYCQEISSYIKTIESEN